MRLLLIKSLTTSRFGRKQSFSPFVSRIFLRFSQMSSNIKRVVFICSLVTLGYLLMAQCADIDQKLGVSDNLILMEHISTSNPVLVDLISSDL